MRSWFGVARFIHKWQSPGRNNIFGKRNSSISIHYQSPVFPKKKKKIAPINQISMWRVLSQRNNTVKHCRDVLGTWEAVGIHRTQSENCTAIGCVNMHFRDWGWLSQHNSDDPSTHFSQTYRCLTKGFPSRSCFPHFLSLSHFPHSLGLPFSSFYLCQALCKYLQYGKMFLPWQSCQGRKVGKNLTRERPLSMLASFIVNLTQARVILEEGTSMEKMFPPAWPVGKPDAFSRSVTDVGGYSLLWAVPSLGWWLWVL